MPVYRGAWAGYGEGWEEDFVRGGGGEGLSVLCVCVC